ncbi:MAG: hypothetical protein KA158_02505 [Leucobacter sp.]|nr:hypothetical protein [Leucobacter sp.]
MLLSLWMMTQFVLLTLVVALGTVQPQSPSLALLLGAAGMLAFAPVVAAIVHSRRVPLVPALQGPHVRTRTSAPPTFSIPTEPGTPGTVLARAPSRSGSRLS